MEKLKNFLITFIGWFDRFNDCLALISGWIIVFTALIIIYEVIMRYLIHRPTTWVSSISEMLLVYCTFLIASYVLRLGGHTKVDIIEMLFKKKRKVILEIIQDIFSLFFCVVFTWLTWVTFRDSFQTQERNTGGIFSFPMWIMYVVIPFGSFLLCLQLIRQVVDHFIYLFKNHPQEFESKEREV